MSTALGASVGVLTPLALQTAVVGTGLVAVAIIGDGPFVDGPVDEPGEVAESVDALN